PRATPPPVGGCSTTCLGSATPPVSGSSKGGMEERRYTALLDDLVAAAQPPAVLPEAAGLASEASPPLVAKAWRRLRKAVRRAGATPSDEALHQIRIRAKRARYAAEAVKPVVGR